MFLKMTVSSYILISILIIVLTRQLNCIQSVERSIGCYHNGTIYANGSLIPTIEPCLNCQCIMSNLICGLRICSDQPVPPPRGCLLVKRNGICCSYLLCKKLHHAYNDFRDSENRISSSSWNMRRDVSNQLKADKTTISSVYSNDVKGSNNNDFNYFGDRRKEPNDMFYNEALKRNLQSNNYYADELNEACAYNGTIYKSGSAMSTSSLCSYCFCIGGKQKCVRPKCVVPTIPTDCKPIYAEQSCCPIRYACLRSFPTNSNNERHIVNSTSIDGIRYQPKNKHYLRTRKRQSRGCIFNKYYYSEGQRLPGNESNPCEICFCIRGSKKCGPKKCSPPIDYCRPIIQTGECCPARYDCGHIFQSHKISDSRQVKLLDRDHAARQFDLLSMFFGSEDNITESEENASMTGGSLQNNNSSAQGSSFFDVIRQGLNYIDNNTDDFSDDLSMSNETFDEYEFINKNITSVPNQDVENGTLIEKLEENNSEEEEETEEVDGEEEDFNLFDLILGNVDIQKSTTIAAPTTVRIKYSEVNSDYLQSPNIIFENMTVIQLSNASLSNNTNISLQSSQEAIKVNESTQVIMSVPYSSEDSIESYAVNDTEVSTTELLTTLNDSSEFFIEELTETANLEQTTTEESTLNGTSKTSIFPFATTTFNYEEDSTKSETQSQTTVYSTTILETKKPSTVKDNEITTLKPLLSNNSTSRLTTTERSIKKTTTAPTEKSTIGNISTTSLKVVINETTAQPTILNIASKSGNVTKSTENQTESLLKPITISPVISRITVKIPPSQSSSLVIISNPSILESDANYDYVEPTLPPSLPNLKIIPFLPTDAVKKNDPSTGLSKYNLYKSNPTHYPSIITPINQNENENHQFISGLSLYSSNPPQPLHTSISYPSITEPQPIYDDRSNIGSSNDENIHILSHSYNPVDKSSYIIDGDSSDYSDYVSYENLPERHAESIVNNSQNKNGDDSSDTLNSNIGLLNDYHPDLYNSYGGPLYHNSDSSYSPIEKDMFVNPIKFSTIDPILIQNINNFSPPKETEGGFVPREQNGDESIYQTNINHDIYIHQQFSDLNTTVDVQLRENHSNYRLGTSTSPNPFHDVIKTEPPPKLQLLIEDKEKLLQNRFNESNGFLEYPTPAFSTSLDKYIVNKDYGSGAVQSGFDQLDDIISITTDSNFYLSTDKVSIVEPEKPIFHSSTNPNKHLNESINLITIVTPIPKLRNKVNVNNKTGSYDLLSSTTEFKYLSENHAEGFLNSFLESLFERKDDPLHDDNEVEMDTQHSVKESTTVIYPISNITKEMLGNSKRKHTTSKYSHHQVQRINDKIIENFIPPMMSTNSQKMKITTIPPTSTITSNNPITVSSSSSMEISKDNHIDRYSTSNGVAEIFTKPSKLTHSNSLTSILRIAGCNIYGRMYRVGRIIFELSNPCLECKCTESGVKCTPLSC